jgi:hypothetical protein
MSTPSPFFNDAAPPLSARPLLSSLLFFFLPFVRGLIRRSFCCSLTRCPPRLSVPASATGLLLDNCFFFFSELREIPPLSEDTTYPCCGPSPSPLHFLSRYYYYYCFAYQHPSLFLFLSSSLCCAVVVCCRGVLSCSLGVSHRVSFCVCPNYSILGIAASTYINNHLTQNVSFFFSAFLTSNLITCIDSLLA